MGLILDYLGKKHPFFKDHGSKIILFIDITWFLLYVYLLLHARDILLTSCDLYKQDMVCFKKSEWNFSALDINISMPEAISQDNFSLIQAELP